MYLRILSECMLSRDNETEEIKERMEELEDKLVQNEVKAEFKAPSVTVRTDVIEVEIQGRENDTAEEIKEMAIDVHNGALEKKKEMEWQFDNR